MPKNTAPHKKPGTKPVRIDPDQLRVLAGMQCTYEEIAAVFGIRKRRFIDRLNAEPELKIMVEEGWANGRASVRREQFKLLAAGNATMAVWLGKQYLGQRDNLDSKLTGTGLHGEIEVHVSPVELLERGIARILERQRSQGDSERLNGSATT